VLDLGQNQPTAPAKGPVPGEPHFVMDVTVLWGFPRYHQVEIRGAAVELDHPHWETGTERMVASAQCILLATRSDLDGEVEVEVEVRVAGELSTSRPANCGPALGGLARRGRIRPWSPPQTGRSPP
jgi:hypothetical protein